MSSVTEKLLEDEISSHLVEHGGYRICKVGVEPECRQDFDAVRETEFRGQCVPKQSLGTREIEHATK